MHFIKQSLKIDRQHFCQSVLFIPIQFSSQSQSRKKLISTPYASLSDCCLITIIGICADQVSLIVTCEGEDGIRSDYQIFIIMHYLQNITKSTFTEIKKKKKRKRLNNT